jgi:outer membrane protein TolC
MNLRSWEQSIHVEVRKAVRGVDSGVKRIRAAEANVMLQRKKLEAEEKKFENGMSTSFEVLVFQDDLSDSELARIRALVDYRVSLVALEKAQGTLLESRGLTLKY